MPHSNCQCPSPSSSAACWKGCLLWKSLESGEKDAIDGRELSAVKCLYMIPLSRLEFFDVQLLYSPWKTSLFQISEMKREKQVLLCIYCRGQPHFLCLLPIPPYWDDVCVGYICKFHCVCARERENRVPDRHGKGIRQMCCYVWVDQALGFYCCFSRGPLGFFKSFCEVLRESKKKCNFTLSLSHLHSITTIWTI